jgi:hypothetical protein
MTTSNRTRHWPRILWMPGPVPLAMGIFIDPTIWRGLWTRRAAGRGQR